MTKKYALKSVFEDDRVPVLNSSQLDPQALGEAMEAIHRRDGEVTAHAIWLEARGNPRHPFYKHIDWDLAVAAQKWQIHQTRKLMSFVYVERGEPFEGVPAFISVTSDDGHRSYKSVDTIAENVDLLQSLFEQAAAELASMERRYSMLTGFVEEAKALRRKLERRARRGKAAAPEARP